VTRVNAVQLAEKNRFALKALYVDVCRRLQTSGKQGELDDFEAHLALWTVSMNMWDDDMAMFLEKGYHRNIVHKSQADREAFAWLGGDLGDVPSLEQSMADNDPNWFPKRNAYRQSIENEENFKYGALFIEGEALGKYGHYAVILEKTYVNEYVEMFLVKRDSLEYVNESFAFDLKTFCGDLACKDNVHELIVVKHEEDLLQNCSQALSRLCYANSNEDRSYLEAQINDEVRDAHIGRIVILSKGTSKNTRFTNRLIFFGRVAC
jgi:hypothetical protein